MKTIEQINQILNDFLEPFDCYAVPSTDFAYYPAKNKIEYAFILPERAEKAYQSFINSNFPRIKADPFLWAFFHELGHHETEEDITDEEWIDYTDNIIGCFDYKKYFYSPVEFKATSWAASYMMTHVDEISNFWNILSPLIITFYDEMEVNYES